jgi:hypothetical protein
MLWIQDVVWDTRDVFGDVEIEDGEPFVLGLG